MSKKRVTEDGEIVDATDAAMRRGFEILFKTPFNHDTEAEARRTATGNFEETRTQQHAKDETDINIILKKFGVTHESARASMPPSFINVPDHLDMQTVLQIVDQAEDSFLALPAEVRARFDNDLARYVGFVDDRIRAGDTPTLREMGLVAPEAPTEPPKEPPQGGSKKTDT